MVVLNREVERDMLERTLGCFVEKDVRGRHYYGANPDLSEMTDSWDFPHLLETNDGQRYARILKTVAYIAVDEDQYGQPVVEKWNITSHDSWQKAYL